jgi:hypothetical protein
VGLIVWIAVLIAVGIVLYYGGRVAWDYFMAKGGTFVK